MTLARDWREFIELLNSHEVEYIGVGAWARAFHGVPRSTGYPSGRPKDLTDVDAVSDD